MRKLLVVAIASLLSVQFGMAQRGGGKGGGKGGPPAAPAPPPPLGLECFDSLGTPEFPTAALQAHIDGSVWFTAEVTAQGTLGKVDTQVVSAYADGPKLLTPPAEAVLRAGKIKSDCAGKTVLVVFRYELHGDPVAKPEVTSKREPPHVVWIESQPMPRPATKAATK